MTFCGTSHQKTVVFSLILMTKTIKELKDQGEKRKSTAAADCHKSLINYLNKNINFLGDLIVLF